MADIQVRNAFVDKILTSNDGVWGLRTSEPHSRKNQNGGYDTTGRTFRTLRGRDIDWSQFQERDRITFYGREETTEREHDGKKYYDLIVWVDAIRKHQPTQQQADPWAAAQPTQGAETWAEPGAFDDPTPF